MQHSEYQKMAELEQTYWWFVGRQYILSKQLDQLQLPKSTKILNVGSGTGGTVPLLEQFGRTTNVDVAEEAIAYSKQRGISVAKIEPHQSLPFVDQSFELVVAFDVLEHIEHDDDALRDWFRVLRPGSFVMITVPAYSWLWSSHDEGLQHFRRYTVSSLHQKLNRAGFIMVKRSYCITFSFPLIVLYRFVRSLQSHNRRKQEHASESYVRLPPWVNALFIFALRMESLMLSKMNMPFGTSIIAIGQKPK